MKNIIKYTLILLVALSTHSCGWLDVASKDKIMENDLFSSRKKFLSALNGVYVEFVASSSSYGSTLSCGTLDVMAQYYNVRNTAEHRLISYANYSYDQDGVKSTFDAVWSTAYTLIANVNTIIEKCDERGDVLGSRLQPIVKGEALALRAMLHFDMLRLYGPIYSAETKDLPAIPYMTKADQVVQPLSSSEAILDVIINDLKSALSLLESDPVRTEGRLAQDGVNGNQLSYRQYRLNYFAVKALMARVYLWKGDKAQALKNATEVINDCQNREKPEESLFPFVTSDAANHPTDPDRVFSTEVLFALYNMSRTNLFKSNFNYTLNSTTILTFAADNLTSGRLSFMYPDGNDYRYKAWAVGVANSSDVIYHRKYEDVTGNEKYSTSSFRYMIPLIRLSEMYLIAAECTTNIVDAVEYINILRRSRACVDVNTEDPIQLERFILEEFRREVLGEGQMFFMYKRKGMRNIPNGSEFSQEINLELGSYVMPLPDSEIEQRGESVK